MNKLFLLPIAVFTIMLNAMVIKEVKIIENNETEIQEQELSQSDYNPPISDEALCRILLANLELSIWLNNELDPHKQLEEINLDQLKNKFFGIFTTEFPNNNNYTSYTLSEPKKKETFATTKLEWTNTIRHLNKSLLEKPNKLVLDLEIALVQARSPLYFTKDIN